MRIFLTGGTGFLGGAFAELATAEGVDVVALARPGSRTKRLEAIGATLCRGDLSDPAVLAAGMRACDGVLHAASPLGGWGPPTPYREVTVEGTRHVVEAMRIASVPTLVHISTVDVHGLDPTRGGSVCEEDAPGKEFLPFDHYGRSKVAAERIVRSAHEDGSIVATVLRPGLIYGPGDENAYARFADLWRRGLAVSFGRGGNVLALTHVRHVAHAAWAVFLKRSLDHRVYLCATDGVVTQREYLASIARAVGRTRPPLAVPMSALLGTAAGLERLSVATRYRIPVALSRFVVHLLGSDWRFDQHRIESELGWSPEIGYAEGFAQTEDWYRRTRGLPRR